MKGLLMRDYSIGMDIFFRTYLIVDVVLFLLYIFSSFNLFLFIILGNVGMIPANVFSIDRKEKWTQYSATLPYSRKQIIQSKYILGIKSIFITSSVILLWMFIFDLLNKQFYISKILVCFFWMIGTAMFISALSLLMCIKFESEIGVIITNAVYFLVMVFISSITISSHNFFMMMKVAVIAFVIAAVLYAISYQCAVKLYEAKEL